MNTRFLVSVIIPAYNAGLYIKKCIKSVIEQTYSNIEILIINDGSTDDTLHIAEKLSKTDNRIRLLIQRNLGVSAARNNGIKNAKGEYLIFVDGDDYLAADYIEYMLGLIEQTHSDFCLSKCCFTKKDEKQTENQRVEILTQEEATALLLSPEIIVGCWNKIFKRTFLINNSIFFSTALFYGEGLNFITSAAQLANSVGVGNRKVYYYRRNNIISATSKFDIEKVYNGEKAIDTIEETLRVKSDKVNTMLILHRSLYYAYARVKIRANHVKRQYNQDDKRWMQYLNRNVGMLLFRHDVSLYRKALLLATCINPWFVMKMDTIRRRKICKESVKE